MTKKKPRKKKHKQVPIVDRYGDTVFKVDEGLQSLIQFLFNKGVRTRNSCEDNFDGEDGIQVVWIEFALDAWMGLASMAFHRNAHDLFEFIKFSQVDLLPGDTSFIDQDGEYWEGTDLLWSASVRFNREHLAYFEQLLRDTLGGTKASPEGGNFCNKLHPGLQSGHPGLVCQWGIDRPTGKFDRVLQGAGATLPWID